jgi:hypothetical protein
MLNTPALQSPSVASNIFTFSLSGNAGTIYLIQTATNLFDWNTVATVTNSADSQQFTLTNPPATAQFYRAIISR